LVAKIRSGADPLSNYLEVNVSPPFLLAIARTNRTEPELRTLVRNEFNRLLGTPGFLEGPVRETIRQRPETQRLAQTAPTGDARKRLNRLLLEDAYPREVRRQTLYFDEQRIGYLFAYCGLVSVFIQGGVIGRLVKRFGERRVILSSLVIIAVSLLLIPWVDSLSGLLLALGLFSVGSGINRAPTMGLLSMYADPSEQGATLGVAQSAGTLARVIAPVLATSLHVLSPHAPYWFAALVAGAAALIAWRYLFAAEDGDEPAPGAGRRF
jgi:hypothetical protein